MSSGNPFRASQLYQQPSTSSVPPTSLVSHSDDVSYVGGRDGEHDASAPLAPRTRKHVRIQSSSNTFISPRPDESIFDQVLVNTGAHGSAGRHYADVLPTTNPVNRSFAVTQLKQERQYDAREGYVQVTAGTPPDSATQIHGDWIVQSPSRAPHNPFSRTLASMEPQKNSNQEQRPNSQGTLVAQSKASLDVEGFKNLLMAGKASPRASVALSQISAPPTSFRSAQAESGGSKDTSLISRKPLFEAQEIVSDLSKTSSEVVDSGDENASAATNIKVEKKKPPPPKHRHGKPVTPRHPQVVSFDSFATEPTVSPTTRPRDNSDAPKPLPPTPTMPPRPLHIVVPTIAPSLSRSEEASVTLSLPTPLKKTPPPVPLARRQSQLRSSGASNRSRSNSSLTISSQQSIDAFHSPAPSNHDPLSNFKSPPPPPPSRYGARLADTETSSANSSTTEPLQRSPSIRATITSDTPSLSRRTTPDSEPGMPEFSTPNISRTPSIVSNRNSQRGVSTESSSFMPPPPPPPRRKQGNWPSMDSPRPYNPIPPLADSRRTSGEIKRISLDGKRRPSVTSESSLRHEYAIVDRSDANDSALYSPQKALQEAPHSKAELGVISIEPATSASSNILDDMEKFQQEIDALRGRYK